MAAVAAGTCPPASAALVAAASALAATGAGATCAVALAKLAAWPVAMAVEAASWNAGRSPVFSAEAACTASGVSGAARGAAIEPITLPPPWIKDVAPLRPLLSPAAAVTSGLEPALGPMLNALPPERPEGPALLEAPPSEREIRGPAPAGSDGTAEGSAALFWSNRRSVWLEIRRARPGRERGQVSRVVSGAGIEGAERL